VAETEAVDIAADRQAEETVAVDTAADRQAAVHVEAIPAADRAEARRLPVAAARRPGMAADNGLQSVSWHASLTVRRLREESPALPQIGRKTGGKIDPEKKKG
jgi:hypothetical protein